MNILDTLKAEANNLGFILLGSTIPHTPAHWDVFQRWLAAGRHATMGYLNSPRSLERRINPATILPGARAILSFALPYPSPLSPEFQSLTHGTRVAAYAWGEDYHELIPLKLESLLEILRRTSGRDIQAKIYTDSGPILERDFAQSAGLGWIGKNTCLINPAFGSFFFLAEIITDFEITESQPFTADRCGSCDRCVQACPTGAILPDRTLDARRCISYLTIENKGEIPANLRKAVGNWVFGCDICQEVCPWNRRPLSILPDPALLPRSDWLPLDLPNLLTLKAQEFNHIFRKSPIARARRLGLLRNAAVVLGNQKNTDALPALTNLLFTDPEALLRSHAAWSLGQINTPAALAALQKAASLETELPVLDEIHASLRDDSLKAG